MTKAQRIAGLLFEIVKDTDYRGADLTARIAAKLEAEYGPVEEILHEHLDSVRRGGSDHARLTVGAYPLTIRAAKQLDRYHDNGDGTGQITERKERT